MQLPKNSKKKHSNKDTENEKNKIIINWAR